MNQADAHFSERGRTVIAKLTGEIDLSNAESLGAAVVEGIPNHQLDLVLDLTSLDYVDSAGIQLIYRLRELLRVRGQSLCLVVPEQSPAQDALRLAGVTLQIPMYRTVEGALEGQASARG
jgi:anti-sigma B factor antagonist